MKTARLLFYLLFLPLLLAAISRAQMGQPAGKQDAPAAAARPAGDVVPLPSSASLTPAQRAGKKLFVQRCSVCHLPMLPSYTPFGPLLDGKLVAQRGDAAVRQQILQGSARMPGWQYTLSPAEIDQLIEYLKTLDFTKKQ